MSVDREATKMPVSPVKLVIVGCGAITEQSYLPSLANMPEFEVVSLVDRDVERARMLARQYHIAHWVPTIDEIPAGVEAAVVALPNYLHQPVSCELMQNKLHVFCEKPMATTKADAETMVRCATEHSVQLHIGNMRRFYWVNRRVKEIVASKELGDLLSFHIEEGYVHNWPTASGFYFDMTKSGGGVLMDNGAHVIDLVLWWLQEYPTKIEYQDDNFEGMEADCHLALEFGDALTGSIRLSRLVKLQNKYILRFQHGTVTFQPYDPSGICNSITIDQNGKQNLLKSEKSLGFLDYFRQQLEHFSHSMRSGLPATTSADAIIPSIQVIEDCYHKATRLKLPWLHPQVPFDAGRRDVHRHLGHWKILITGASGFIGGRVAERLYFDYGNMPRCFVRNFNKLARLSRFPVKITLGDVLDYDALLEAVDGCDAVIHCAYGNTPNEDMNVEINTVGTQNIIQASLHHRIKKLIYLSSVEVYGAQPPDVVDEQTAVNASTESYAQSKWAAEKLCMQSFHSDALPVVILRPTVVYGPHAPIWTIDVINRLLSRGFCLSDAFNGLCNPIYIDDCVDAILLALSRDDVAGEAFNINSGEKITWNQYFDAYNRILDMPPLRKASKIELQLYWAVRKLFDMGYNYFKPQYGNDMFYTYTQLRERKKIPNVKGFLQRGSLLDGVEIFNRQTFYSIEKAKRYLGFEPRYGFEDGIHMVRHWLAHSL